MTSTGLATIVPFGFDFDPVDFLSAMHSLGCETAQFYRNEEDPPDAEEAIAAVEEVGMRYDSIHGVFGENYDPSSPDQSERTRCVEVYTREGQLARSLGGDAVVVHPSAWTPGRRVLSKDEAQAEQNKRWGHLRSFMEHMARVGERLGVRYLIENQPRNCWLGHDAPRLAQVVRELNSPFIRMCFDTGHAHITGTIADDFRACADVVDYIHVHSNDRIVDDHRMPGDGTIDWDTLAPLLKEHGSTRMFEVFYEPDKVRQMNTNGLGQRLRDWLANGPA